MKYRQTCYQICQLPQIRFRQQYNRKMGANQQKRQKHQKLNIPLLPQNQQSMVLQSSKEFHSELIITESMNPDQTHNINYSGIQLDHDQIPKAQYCQKEEEMEQKKVQENQGQQRGGATWEDCIGVVMSKFNKRVQISTGTLIGEKAVLTCAKSIYDKETQSFAKEIKFHLKSNGKKSKLYEVKEYHYPPKYKKPSKESQKLNFAILQLQSKKLHTSFVFADEKQKQLISQANIDVYGYSDEDEGKFSLALKNQNISVQDDIFYYLADGGKGQNGNPILVNGKVVGIQMKIGEDLDINTGIYFNLESRKMIRNWLIGITQKQKFLSKIDGRTSMSKAKAKQLNGEGLEWNEMWQMAEGNQSQIAFLNLNQVYFSHEQLNQLASFENLIELSLWGNNLTVNSLNVLSKIHFYNLLKLNLGFNYLKDEGMYYVKKFTTLRELHLQENMITALGMKMLANGKTEFHKNLSILYLWGNQLENDGLKYMKSFENLTELYLFRNEIETEGVRHLVKEPLKKLKKLDLMYNKIDTSGAKQLAKLQTLEQLYLFSNKIGTQGLIQLSSKKLKQLKVLDIGQNRIDDCGVELLERFSGISQLFLSGNFIRSEGLLKLIQIMPKLPLLSVLAIRNNKFSFSQGKQFCRRVKNKSIQIKI